MIKSRNRVTPILVIILIIVFWVFIGVLIYKLQQNISKNKVNTFSELDFIVKLNKVIL